MEQEVLAKVRAGERVTLRAALQSAGVAKAVESTLREAIAAASDGQTADAIAQDLTSLHRQLTAPQLVEVHALFTQRIEAAGAAWARALVSSVLGWRGAFWMETRVNARLHTPFDFQRGAGDSLDQFVERNADGKLTAHTVHMDSWYRCPLNSINLWVAIGRVIDGNGMIFYPDVYRRVPRSITAIDELAGCALGRPEVVRMVAGDVLVFHGDLLHGSVLNCTDETRVVMSFRITFEPPVFALPTAQVYREIAAEAGAEEVGTIVADAWYLAAEGVAPLRRVDDPLPVESDQHGALRFTLDQLPVGAVRALDANRCVARTRGDEIAVFARHCPHRGADLAMGSLAGQAIRCPWHDAHFELRSGRSPCRALTLPGVELALIEGGTAYIAG